MWTSCLCHVRLSKALDEVVVVLRWSLLKDAVVDVVTFYGGREVLGASGQTACCLRCHVAPLRWHKVYQHCRRLSGLLSTSAWHVHMCWIWIVARLQHNKYRRTSTLYTWFGQTSSDIYHHFTCSWNIWKDNFMNKDSNQQAATKQEQWAKHMVKSLTEERRRRCALWDAERRRSFSADIARTISSISSLIPFTGASCQSMANRSVEAAGRGRHLLISSSTTVITNYMKTHSHTS